MQTNSPLGVGSIQPLSALPASHGPGLLRRAPDHSQCRGCPDQEGVSWGESEALGVCQEGPTFISSKLSFLAQV